ncbi:MAG: TonB-dependent receptor plug domain-containing protein [Bacteroidales bacterium]|nr:TonB-dependent receptor plug domain-containing protein [Bacteroidales bacterium]
MRKILLLTAFAAVCATSLAQEKVQRLDSVVVSSSRAGKDTPVAFTEVGKAELLSSNPSNSIPMTLNLLPSVVTYNEGGTGLGNSAMTIRGSKGSQINVTLNGITLNDAESQEVFWVNIPALSALISGVQVQRGLGTSANGAGAFGASINMNTAFASQKAWGRTQYVTGSYNTNMVIHAGSTGISRHGLYASIAYSKGNTDGYIRNAFVQSGSAFFALGWLGGNQSLRFTYLKGNQRSGITWDGIDLEQYNKDRTYNGAGEYYDDLGNVYYYPNQTDNYRQHHLQGNYTRAFKPNLVLSTTLNYTRGDGYDEYYKRNKKLKNYGFKDLPDGTPSKSDITYRKKLDNDLWVLKSDLGYTSSNLDIKAGAYFSSHRGSHWGELLWAKQLGKDYNYSSVDWYDNNGKKDDASLFARAEYRPLQGVTAYTDLQYRGIRYIFKGTDDDFLEYGSKAADVIDYSNFWGFFNPRAGITAVRGAHKAFASIAFGHREPGRGDIKENVKGDGADIVPEKMLDLELGYVYSGEGYSASANIYMMEYKDMLLETGRLSSSGYAIKENVPRAWRRGVELAAASRLLSWLRADANLTLSLNEIADYTSYVPYEDYSATHPVHYGKTTMLLSPSTVGMIRLEATPLRSTQFTADYKYVGKQYLDNSMREDLAVPAYGVMNISASRTFSLLGRSSLVVSAYVNNLLNQLYYASGWRWESYNPDSDTISYGVGVYPQAPRNWMLKASLNF